MATKALALARRNSTKLYGRYQVNLQHWRGGITFNEKTPICFHMMTPAVQEPVFRYQPTTANPAYYEVGVPVSWAYPSLTQLTGAGPAGAGFLPWSQWSSANDDFINQGKYLLMYTKLTFRIAFKGGNGRFRIDFVKPKWNRILREIQTSNAQNGENHQLPDALGSFTSLLGPSNEINPMYFRKVRKPIYMRCAPDNNLTTPEIQKTVYIKHNKVLNPIEVADTGIYPYAKISVTNQVWCIISTDVEAPTAQTPNVPQPEIVCTRIVGWRDLSGSAA